MRPGLHTDKFKRKFIEKATKRFGAQFTFEKVVYKDNSTKVIITCVDHGDFSIEPGSFIRQTFGCRQCANKKMHQTRGTWTDAKFIAKAQETHNNKYNYDKVDLLTLNSFVTITCPEHGDFLQQACYHLNGTGCRRCNQRDGNRRYDTQAFIEAAEAVHGKGKFQYYMVEYVRGHEKVAIVCPQHGLFDQDASAHLAGGGCPKCDYESRLIGIDEFIRRAELVHGDRYCYLRSEYVRLSDPITITCEIHGDFSQRAGTHLAGSGCQRCAWGPTSKKCSDWLALIALQTGHHIQHAENGGEYHFPEMIKRNADGFDQITETVYEYNGSLFHGEPRLYPADRPHPLIAKKTCGEVYQKTLDRDRWIRDQGYTLVTMWEMDWDAGVKAVIRLQRLWRHCKGISNGRKRVR